MAVFRGRRLAAGGGAVLLGLSLVAGCNDDETAGDPPGTHPAHVVRPAEPVQNDPAFVVTGTPAYVLAGDDLSPGTVDFELRVTPPAGVTAIDLWLDDANFVPLEQKGGDFVVKVPTAELSIGVHQLVLAERDADVGFHRDEFVKGHALYVVISTDWDFADVDNRVLEHHEDLHAVHPELKITHLIGPYTFTDASVSAARRAELVDWAKAMREAHGDEIGLHVHPRCTFVEAAGLPCLTQPSVAYPEGDATGYTVRLGAYTREQWSVLFAKANEIWASVGFGKPTSFRAGAWTLETHVAQALVDSGFIVDSSAVNWPYMEEWLGHDLYTWNQQQWEPINDTSQPYYPTLDALLPGGTGPRIGLLEVPDNGIMVDYWTVDEMKKIFDANYGGAALPHPVQVSTGFHPAPEEYYSEVEYERLDEFFTYVDQLLASQGLGPVVYINMSDANTIWHD